MAVLWRRFQRVGHAHSFAIGIGRSHPEAAYTCRAEQRLIVEMIATAMPPLRKLTIHSTPLQLNYLENFSKLQHLSFTGFSASTSAETLHIPKGLPHLTSIELRRAKASYDLSQKPVRLIGKFCLTPTVIKGLNPLKSFSIVSIDDRIQPYYLSAEMLSAISSHVESLHRFNVFVNMFCKVENEIVNGILDLVHMSGLKELGLAFEMKDWQYARELSRRSYGDRMRGFRGVLPDTIETVTSCVIGRWLASSDGGIEFQALIGYTQFDEDNAKPIE